MRVIVSRSSDDVIWLLKSVLPIAISFKYGVTSLVHRLQRLVCCTHTLLISTLSQYSSVTIPLFKFFLSHIFLASLTNSYALRCLL